MRTDLFVGFTFIYQRLSWLLKVNAEIQVTRRETNLLQVNDAVPFYPGTSPGLQTLRVEPEITGLWCIKGVFSQSGTKGAFMFCLFPLWMMGFRPFNLHRAEKQHRARCAAALRGGRHGLLIFHVCSHFQPATSQRATTWNAVWWFELWRNQLDETAHKHFISSSSWKFFTWRSQTSVGSSGRGTRMLRQTQNLWRSQPVFYHW